MDVVDAIIADHVRFEHLLRDLRARGTDAAVSALIPHQRDPEPIS
ncbi:hypothetical protein [Dactylosporangium salmoneum]|uniref:Uncharacterized protein n=1 Tax=Dactylosporangium salmoneum TaxID=53361 RepID=A0ABP5V3H2_9ACTN